jgi:hypothetical protein
VPHWQETGQFLRGAQFLESHRLSQRLIAPHHTDFIPCNSNIYHQQPQVLLPEARSRDRAASSGARCIRPARSSPIVARSIPTSGMIPATSVKVSCRRDWSLGARSMSVASCGSSPGSTASYKRSVACRFFSNSLPCCFRNACCWWLVPLRCSFTASSICRIVVVC